MRSIKQITAKVRDLQAKLLATTSPTRNRTTKSTAPATLIEILNSLFPLVSKTSLESLTSSIDIDSPAKDLTTNKCHLLLKIIRPKYPTITLKTLQETLTCRSRPIPEPTLHEQHPNPIDVLALKKELNQLKGKLCAMHKQATDIKQARIKKTERTHLITAAKRGESEETCIKLATENQNTGSVRLIDAHRSILNSAVNSNAASTGLADFYFIFTTPGLNLIFINLAYGPSSAILSIAKDVITNIEAKGFQQSRTPRSLATISYLTALKSISSAFAAFAIPKLLLEPAETILPKISILSPLFLSFHSIRIIQKPNINIAIRAIITLLFLTQLAMITPPLMSDNLHTAPSPK